MTCCLPAESSMTCRIELEEEIMEVEPPPADEPKQNTSINKTAEEIKTNDDQPKQSAQQEASKTNEDKRPVYYITHQMPNKDFDSDSEPLVISDDEPDEPPEAVQRPAAAQTPAPMQTHVAVTLAMAVPQSEPREQVNPEAQEEQEKEALSRKRGRNDDCSRSLPQLQQITCRRQNNDKAFSSTGEDSQKKENAKAKQNAKGDEGEPDTQDEKANEEDKDEAGEESYCPKKQKVEELEGDIYGCSDDSTESYYVYE